MAGTTDQGSTPEQGVPAAVMAADNAPTGDAPAASVTGPPPPGGRHRVARGRGSARAAWLSLSCAIALAVAGITIGRGESSVAAPPTAPTLTQAWSVDPATAGGIPAPAATPVPDAPVTTVTSETMAPGMVLIPAIGTYAPLEAAPIVPADEVDGCEELNVARCLRLPNDPTRVARWEGGQRLVLSGHVNWDGRAGALALLAKVRAGDRAYVTDENGAMTEWAAIGAAREDLKGDKASLFVASDTPELTVLTCGGPFVDGHYRDTIDTTFALVKEPTS